MGWTLREVLGRILCARVHWLAPQGGLATKKGERGALLLNG